MGRKATGGRSQRVETETPSDRGRGRWLLAHYRPVSLFSLRSTLATSKGGKTLVVPTPYAVKMALLDVCFRRYGAEEAEAKAREVFDTVKWREVRVRPPRHCVVQNTFVKVLDPSRAGEPGPFKSTIVYREFVHFEGEMTIALAVSGLDERRAGELAELFACVNSIGKRGSFWQYMGNEVQEGTLPPGFSMGLKEANETGAEGYGLTQALDDFGEALCRAKDGFERVSTYGRGGIKLEEHRVLTVTALPYRRRSASRRFTWYEQIVES